MDTPKIFESEYRFCLILWEHEPIKSSELVKLCGEELGWKPTTVYTVIKRLSERGVLKNEDTLVTSLVSKDEVGAAGAYPSQIVFRTGIEVLNSAAGFASEESNPSGTFAPGAYTPLSDGKEVITDSSDSSAQDQKSEPSYDAAYAGKFDMLEGNKNRSASPSYDGASPNAKASHFTPLGAASAVWLGGVCAMIAYASVSCAMLRRRTRTAVLLRDNIRQSERVSAPFTFGIFRPEIFLPFGVGEREAGYMIAHEKAHIARRDNIIKPASFLLLSVYWFNPVIWAA